METQREAFFGRELYNQFVVWWVKDRYPNMSIADMTQMINHFRTNGVLAKVAAKVAPDIDIETFKSLFFVHAQIHGDRVIQKATWDILDEIKNDDPFVKNNRVLLKEFYDSKRWPWLFHSKPLSKMVHLIWINSWTKVCAEDCERSNLKREEYIKLFLEHHSITDRFLKVPLTKEFILKVELLNCKHGNRFNYVQFISFFGKGEIVCEAECTQENMPYTKEQIAKYTLNKLLRSDEVYAGAPFENAPQSDSLPIPCFDN